MPSSATEERQIRRQALEDALNTRVLVLDGAMGTMLQDRQLTAADFGGPELEGCNENLVFTRPDVVQDVHRAYYEAGSDIVETNSFGATPLVLAEYGLGAKAYEANVAAAKLARSAADKLALPGKPLFVAGSMGPTTKAITVTGGVTFPELVENYTVQARGLIDGGADILLLETCQDTRNIKAGLLAIDRLGQRTQLRHSHHGLGHGRTDWHDARAGRPPKRSTHPSQSRRSAVDRPELRHGSGVHDRPHPHRLHELAATRISCYPNAGLPDEEGKYLETPEIAGRAAGTIRRSRLAEHRGRLLRHHARAHPRHRANGARQEAARSQSSRRTARSFPASKWSRRKTRNRPLIVGERTNVIGSRLFKKMIADEKWEEATEIARWQVRNGAHIIDVCLQSQRPRRDQGHAALL